MEQKPSAKSGGNSGGATNLDRVKVVVYTKSVAQPPVMSALIRQLEGQRGRLEFEILKDPTAILKSVEQTSMTVLILTLHEKEELVEVLNVLSAIQGRLQSGLLRALVINGMNHPRVLALLKAKGVHEIVDFETNIKALNHKIKNALLLVTQTFQRLKNQNIRTSAVVGSDASARGRGGNRNESTNEIQWEKSVEHVSDFWWIPSAKNLRNVMGRWLLDMLGPGPAAGIWEETTYERNGEKGWVWKNRVSTDPTFMPRQGRWIFFGRQPEFVWQKNLWALVSKRPYLAFYAEGQSEPEFVRVDSPQNGKVKVFENSEVSRNFLPKIQASLEASVKLSKTESSSEIRGNFDPGKENSGFATTDYLPADGETSETATPDYLPSDSEEKKGQAGWNDHTGAVGFDFKAKDLRVTKEQARAKWRNALTAGNEVGGKLGLSDIVQSGITSGAKTFQKLVLEVRPIQRNGLELAIKQLVHVIEMTPTHAAVEFPSIGVADRDKFLLNIQFRLGDVEKSFDLEWVVELAQSVDGAGSLVQGVFVGGDLAELANVLKLIAQRQLELKDFFLVAKGA